MNLEKKIYRLINYGLNENFVYSLNESKINSLYERISKKETNEQATQPVNAKVTTKTVKSYELNPNASMEVQAGAVVSSKNGKTTVEMTEEDELNEKFESKSQQGYFWARCNECKSKNCKWCKMAKEFSKSTSEKDYENMPYKKEQSEGYQEALISTYAKGIANNMNKNLINPKFSNESIFQNKLEQIIEKNLKPTMRKQDLTNLINRTMNKRLNEMFADPIEKIKTGTETEYELELEKEYKNDYVVTPCEGGGLLYIKTEEELDNVKVVKISQNGEEICVEVFGKTEKSGKNTDVIESYRTCESCLKGLGDSKGKGKVMSASDTSYGLSTDDTSGSGRTKRSVKQITGPIETPNKFEDPLALPSAKEKQQKLLQQLKRDFDKKSEKLEEIYNRRFK